MAGFRHNTSAKQAEAAADPSSGDYLRYVNIDWDYKYGQPGLIKMKMSSGDKCLDAGLSEPLFLAHTLYLPFPRLQLHSFAASSRA